MQKIDDDLPEIVDVYIEFLKNGKKKKGNK